MDGNKPRILLTGGKGYVGQWVHQALKSKGFDIILLQADLTDKKAIQVELTEASIDVVIHLAGSHSKDQAELHQVNYIGTQNLMSALDLSKLERFVFMSSIHVYGQPTGTVDESSSLDPVSAYGKSKKEVEELLVSKVDPTKLTIFRASNAYGAPKNVATSKWGLLFNDLCKQAFTSNKMLVNSAADKLIDMVWMGHVVEVVEATITGIVPSGTYNLVSGQNKTLSSIADQVKVAWKEYSGKDATIEFGAGKADPSSFRFSRSALDRYIGPYSADAFKQEALAIFSLLQQA